MILAARFFDVYLWHYLPAYLPTYLLRTTCLPYAYYLPTYLLRSAPFRSAVPCVLKDTINIISHIDAGKA